MLRRESFTCGKMWTLHAGSCSLWCSLLIVVAFATLPNAPSKLLVDCVLVGITGSNGLNALAVAPVLLATEGILLLRTPIRRLFFVLFDMVFCQMWLFLSMWLHGSMKQTWHCKWVVDDRVWMLLRYCCGGEDFVGVMMLSFSNLLTRLVRGA